MHIIHQPAIITYALCVRLRIPIISIRGGKYVSTQYTYCAAYMLTRSGAFFFSYTNGYGGVRVRLL
jgi:hypothetical protein